MTGSDSTGHVIGVIGAGTMGRGIAQIAAVGGMRVFMYDTRTEATHEAKGFIDGMINRAVEKNRMTREDADGAIGRLTVAESLKDLADCDIVVEAVVENLDVKGAVFTELEAIVRPDAILTSNTSSLSITDIAARCERPERVAGFHFFNPVPLMALVEVIPGLRTRQDVVDTLMAAGRQMGRDPVLCADSPGFLVNHAGRGFVPESVKMVQDQCARPPEIDRVLRAGPGFRMGPFELLDLVGADIALAVMESIHNQYYQDPLYRPVSMLQTRVAAGLLGRKTGEGFYRYENNKPVAVEPRKPASSPASAVWISQANAKAAETLAALVKDLGVTPQTGGKPGKDAVCLVTPESGTAHEAAMAEGLDPARTIAVDTMFGLETERTLMPTVAVPPELIDATAALFAKDGSGVVVMSADAPGFIAPRIVAMIVNVGCVIAAQGIASGADIDKAVRLGLNYPKGPLEFGDAVGPMRVVTILESLQAHYGDPRYRPSPWLKERARLGLPLAASSDTAKAGAAK